MFSTNSSFPATVFVAQNSRWPLCALTPLKVCLPGPAVGLCVSLSHARQNSSIPPCGCTSSATTPLPKITQPRRYLITHTNWNQKPSSFLFFNVSCPLCFNLSFSRAASCEFCTPNGFWWYLISCAFSLAHLQIPIQALICQVTDDQWSCWLARSARVLPSRVRCTHYTGSCIRPNNIYTHVICIYTVFKGSQAILLKC